MMSWSAIVQKGTASNAVQVKPDVAQKDRIVVIDTNTLIKAINFSNYGDKFYTIAEVLAEVRDVEARRRLEQLHVKLETRVPSKEAVMSVIEFAQKTGDYASLSAADIRLIALTRMLEIESNGERNIRRTPIGHASLFQKPRPAEPNHPKKVIEEKGNALEEEKEKGEEKEVDGNNNDNNNNNNNVAKTVDGDDVDVDDDEEEEEDGEEVPYVEKSSKKSNGAAVGLPGWGDEWVTSADQLHKAEQDSKKGEVVAKDDSRGTSVACMSSDFAMQNVLLQMGLQVVAPDGQRISRVKQWALRCYSCTKITRDMTKLFCPTCGNNTLKRVSVSIDGQGTIVAFLNYKKKINTRGTVYPIPKSHGGRGPKFITDECELPKQYKNKKVGQQEYSFGDPRNRPESKPKIGYGNRLPGDTGKKRTGKKKKNHEQKL